MVRFLLDDHTHHFDTRHLQYDMDFIGDLGRDFIWADLFRSLFSNAWSILLLCSLFIVNEWGIGDKTLNPRKVDEAWEDVIEREETTKTANCHHVWIGCWSGNYMGNMEHFAMNPRAILHPTNSCIEQG
jgi:hypothetical protein